MIFTNIWDLLKDMYDSGSAEIICADQIEGNSFGWVCQQTGKIWAISIPNVSRTGNLAGPDNSQLLSKYFSTAENRRKIFELLNTLPHLQSIKNE